MRSISLLGIMGVLLVVGWAHDAAGQTNISWLTIDGGGAFKSSASGFTVSGTIGQPDAGAMAGGVFGIVGGFWSVTLPLPPELQITLAGPNVVISWPDPSAGFQLQEAIALLAPPGAWSLVPTTPSVVNGEKQVVLPHTGVRRFYRLAKP